MPEDFSRYDASELVNLLSQTPIATAGSSRAGAALGEFARRLDLRLSELNAAIDRLNEASTLISQFS